MEKAKVSMSTSRWKGVGCLLGLMLALVACTTDTPEAELRQRFDDMQAAVEEGRVGDFMDGVSRDFSGDGGMDHAALHNLLKMHTLANARIGATTGPLDVRVDGESASVAFQVLLTGGKGRFLPEQAGAYEVTTAWHREDGDWRVYHAQWEDAR